MTKKQITGVAFSSLSIASVATLLTPMGALAEEEVGMNLLIPKLSEFLPMLVAFLIIWFILSKYAWPAISDMLDKRAETIKESLANAEAARIEAQHLLEEYKAQIADARKESAEILAEAKRSAELVRSDITAKAQLEADEIVTKARAAIENEKKQAISDLQSSVADLSVQVAGRLIGEGLSDADHRRLVEQYVSEVGNLDEN